MEPVPLILASASPRRRELLALLQAPFHVTSADVDESRLPGESPAEMVRRLSMTKARVVAGRQSTGWVIASDTVVVLDGKVLGKPADAEEARVMLRRLRGRAHWVYSGIALCDAASGRCESDVVATEVWMRDYGEDEIEAYVASGDPLDKAGAYGIQNEPFHPVARIAGCYASVMGLPLCHLYRLLRRWGHPLSQSPQAACRAMTDHPCTIQSIDESGEMSADPSVPRT